MTNFTLEKISNMNQLEIWEKLPEKGQMYVYDDYNELAIRLYITNEIIMCSFKHKGKPERQGDFTADFIIESICYGKEIKKEEYDKI